MSEETQKQWFRNVKEVAAYLHDAGYKVSRATVYNHRSQGKLVPDQDGGFTVKAVDRYVKSWLDKVAPVSSLDLAKMQDEKKTAEAKKLEAQAKHWEIKTNILEEKYIEKSVYERDLANRAMLLKSDGDNFFRSMAAEIVSMVDGDIELVADLIEFCLKKWESFLGRYSENREFEVPEVNL